VWTYYMGGSDDSIGMDIALKISLAVVK